MTQSEMNAIRSKGVGGSDIADILSIEPYGCSRRLWYSKRGVEKSNPKKDNPLFDRGHALEPVIAERFFREHPEITGSKRSTAYHPEHGFLFCHLDMWLDGGAIWEGKTAGREMFQRFKRDGMPEYYLTQVQYSMEICRRRHEAGDPLYPDMPQGAFFGVLWPDGWQFKWIKAKREPKIGEALVDDAMDWWLSYMTELSEKHFEGPPRLAADDKRCGSCEYRTECQGKRMLEIAEEAGNEVEFVDMGEDFESKLIQLQGVKESLSALKAEEDKLSAELKKELGGRQAVDVPGWRVTFRASQRAGYTVAPGVVRSLRIYPR